MKTLITILLLILTVCCGGAFAAAADGIAANAFVTTALSLKQCLGMRAATETETAGLDLAEHGEEGYNT